MLGVLGIVGSTAYLLSGLADDSPAKDPSRVAADARPFMADVPMPDPDLHIRLFPLADRWQSLPLLAAQNFTLSGEVEALSFQTALEREKDRAAAAQREITALRGELARVEANEGLVAEYRSAAIEDNERYNTAILRVAALQEELASLRASIVKAQKVAIEEQERTGTASSRGAASHEELAKLKASVIEAQREAESEKEKAAAALQQLEIVQGQLAATRQRELTAMEQQLASAELTEALIAEYRRAALEEKEKADAALQQLEVLQGQLAARASPENDRADIKGHPHQQSEQSAAPHPHDRTEQLPATAVFQLPMPLAAYQPLPDDPEKSGDQFSRQDKDKAAKSGKDRQVARLPAAKVLTRPDKNAAATPMRSRRAPMEPEAVGAAEARRESRHPGVRPVERPLPKVAQKPRLLAQDERELSSPGALSLPRALLPDSRLW